MLALSVEAHRTGCAVVVATGELDLAGARRVLDRMDRLITEGRDRVVLDMAGVAFCGAQAMSALVRTRARAQRSGGWLRLAAVPPHVRRVFERTDLDRLFPRYPDVASAATGRAVPAGEPRAVPGAGPRAAAGGPRAVPAAEPGAGPDGGTGAPARRTVSRNERRALPGGVPAPDGRSVSSGDRGVAEREPPSQAR
ncbi:STAS domain-containing protein [Saccharothrix sp. HUAS TT1]|uniref:STAS domain-containing protein n=1 Tax=unclassified Saccharothrix TaxID=2593673 RepID=UPI00345B6323